jgi:AraC family transcriptional regulator
MLLTLTTVFNSELVCVRHAVARPSADPCSEVERGAAELLLMPITGLFAKHDGPKQHFIANSNHALLLGLGGPYRISFPDGKGDESLVVQFSKGALASLLAETVGVEDLSSPRLNAHCLLAPATVLDRNVLQRHLAQGAADPLAVEELCVAILSGSLHAAYRDLRGPQRARHCLTMLRRRQQVEQVKELISLYPTREWTLDTLARHANTSPYHLTRVFREEVGVPVHQYLIRTRLGMALEALRATDLSVNSTLNLTKIALETGFANHSHFTSSFRSLFGVTPSQWRGDDVDKITHHAARTSLADAR